MSNNKANSIQSSEVVTYLRNTSYFGKLPLDKLNKIASICTIIQLEKDEFLFHQGATSDGFYILLDGRLAAVLEKDNNKEIVGVIHQGETVGELGAFSQKPRSLGIQAYCHSTLIFLSYNQIRNFIENYASVDTIMEMVSTLVDRSQSILKRLAKESQHRHCVIIPATNAPICSAFLQGFKTYLTKAHGLLIVDRQYFVDHSIDDSISSLKALIRHAEKEKLTIIFIIETIERLQAYLDYYNQSNGPDIFQWIDKIYVLAKADKPTAISPQVKLILEDDFLPLVSHKDLILWHGNSKQLPRDTITWLEQANFNIHHHIRDEQGDFLRLFRFVLGKANALVLGGGGVRGWASLGVITALEEHGIQIDAIAGTSAGSFLASAYARSMDVQLSHKMVQPLINLSGFFKMRQLSFPIISINNGALLTEKLKVVFEPYNIEDLWIFNFSIASNLSTYQEEIQRRGILWEALRCSGSLPIIFPPFVRNGEMLIDGGLLNNLPVDHMKKIIGSSHHVIAVNLTDFTSKSEYDFPPVIGFWPALKNKLGWMQNSFKHPPFVESILKSLMLGASYRLIENTKQANLLIDFKLTDVPLIYYPEDKIPKLIERGYKRTLPFLKSIEVDPETGIIKSLAQKD